MHYALVQAFDVNPWKLSGFAMYVTPRKTKTIVWDETGATPRIISAMDLSADVRDEFDRFSLRRSALGKLATPTDLVNAVFESTPDTQRIRVRISVTALARTWSELETRYTDYKYTRR